MEAGMLVSESMKVLLLFLFGVQSAWAGWGVTIAAEDERGRAGAAKLTYKPGDGESLEGALEQLVDRQKILRLNSIYLEILKDDAMNQQLVKALEMHVGKATSDLAPGIGWGSFHHPDVREFRQQLQPALLSLAPFDKLPAALAKHGLMIGGSGCEKFSFDRREEGTRVTGMGIWLHVAAVDFGMPMGKVGMNGSFSLSEVFREGDDWVGLFSMAPDQEKDIRFYGRWSPEHKMYVSDKHQMGWTEGVKWSSSDAPAFADTAQTFRLKKGTSHAVRIELGSESRARTRVRAYGPGIMLDSEEFILGEQSYSYREKE